MVNLAWQSSALIGFFLFIFFISVSIAHLHCSQTGDDWALFEVFSSCNNSDGMTLLHTAMTREVRHGSLVYAIRAYLNEPVLSLSLSLALPTMSDTHTQPFPATR